MRISDRGIKTALGPRLLQRLSRRYDALIECGLKLDARLCRPPPYHPARKSGEPLPKQSKAKNLLDRPAAYKTGTKQMSIDGF